ncbi:myotubularin-related protein 10-A-like [Chiloscyllium punctatum]
MSDRLVGVKLLPGEKVRGEAPNVRKCTSYKQVQKSITGKLLCTNFRVAFVPVETGVLQDPAGQRHLLGADDVTLSSIDRVVAVNSSRNKLLLATSSLKTQAQELLIYCKDFRLLHFQFEHEPSTDELISLIARSCQPVSPRELFVFEFAVEMSNPIDPRLVNSNPEQEFEATRMFETHLDWEFELARTGALGWRVSLVNERFEVSASLSKVLVVPRKILDLDIKDAGAYFTEGRVPRWHWHHRGSNLMRMSNIQSNTYPQRDGVSKLEELLYGAHCRLVIADLSDDLPNTLEIQQAYSKLRALCSCENPSSLKDSDEKWLSTLEGTHWLEYVRLCLKKASEISSLLSNQRLTVTLQETDDRDLACVISSLVQVQLDPYCRTILGFQSLLQKEWVEAGHRFSDRFNQLRATEKDESPVFLLFLDCVWQLLDHYRGFFEFTDRYLMALHNSTHTVLFGTFLFNCSRERTYIQQSPPIGMNTRMTPFTNDWSLSRNAQRVQQVVLKGGFFSRDERNCPLPSVWDWSLQFPTGHQQLFRNALYSGDTQSMVQNGLSQHHNTEKLDILPLRSVYLLSKGVLLTAPQFLPWKNTSVTKKLSKLSQSLESLLELEQPQRISPAPSLDPSGLLLPPIPAASIRFWKSCYLRWLTQVEVENTYGLLSALTAQISCLQQRLQQQTSQQNRVSNGLDHQGNQIALSDNQQGSITPPPTYRTDSTTMETSFSMLVGSTTW